MPLQRAVWSCGAGILAVANLLIFGTVQAALVPVAVDCPGGPGNPPRVTPDFVAVGPGDIVQWTTDGTCSGGACGAFYYRIVIPPCPPLFPLGFDSGQVPMTQPISSPAAAAEQGICKYTVNLYNISGDLCDTLDPYIKGQAYVPAVPAASLGGLLALAALLVGGGAWMLAKRRATNL